ncbi:hypothetical protein B296_00017086 [Ensete ventricosum]|uniref:Uncharacterized protein n=1 Tax=Ensete ventricosum TaxID=4639 RepID=A0A427A7M1_ENSVE|nr:hypothetical protein B296_00017086 [Ensete ventricosum]
MVIDATREGTAVNSTCYPHVCRVSESQRKRVLHGETGPGCQILTEPPSDSSAGYSWRYPTYDWVPLLPHVTPLSACYLNGSYFPFRGVEAGRILSARIL